MYASVCLLMPWDALLTEAILRWQRSDDIKWYSPVPPPEAIWPKIRIRRILRLLKIRSVVYRAIDRCLTRGNFTHAEYAAARLPQSGLAT